MAITISESRNKLIKFLEDNQVGVLAITSSLGKPHAATIYITSDQDLNMYFVTRRDTQKSQNVQDTHQAVLAVYNATTQSHYRLTVV